MSAKLMHKSVIKQFIALTNASEQTAIDILKVHNWQVEAAVNAYLDSHASSAHSSDTGNAAKLNALFDKYKDADEDVISSDGFESLCKDLDIDSGDIVTFVISWKLKSDQMATFTRQGWIDGWSSLQCDSLEKMKVSVAAMRAQLDDPETFKDVYNYLFDLARGDQKSLALDMAIALWEIMLVGRYSKLAIWIQFVQESHGKSISRDTWRLFLDFALTSKDDLSGYDMSAAWPVLIDEFVEYLQSNMDTN